MAELARADVVQFTGGRLSDDGATGETQRMLDAALQVARREAGWHVSPIKPAHSVTLDGPGSRILWLPTRKVTTMTSVTESGNALTLSTLNWSVGDVPERGAPVRMRKKSGGWWSCDYGDITVVMSHGYTEAEAVDWRQAILSMVDQMSLLPVKASTGMSDFGQRSWRVDDVQVAYNPYAAMAEEVVFSISHIIETFCLPPAEFI